MGIQTVLLVARFYTTIGHLIVLLVLFSTIQSNINASLPDNPSSGEKDNATKSSLAAIIFGLFCFLFDIGGIVTGTSFFSASANFFQIIVHFVGGVVTSRFIVDNWGFEALWPIVVCCNLPSAILELWIILSVSCIRKVT